MTNSQRASQLLAEGEAILKEAKSLFERQIWNLCIRRCQEVVELILKAMLIQMGKDYPKIHDVAPLVVRTLEAMDLEPDAEFSEWLLSFSATLAARRAPAFYFERDYSQAEAEESLEGAHKLLEFVESFFRENA